MAIAFGKIETKRKVISTENSSKKRKKSTVIDSIDSQAVKQLNALGLLSTVLMRSTTLLLVDIAHTVDKYFILQLIKDRNTSNCYFFARWGASGTIGESVLHERMSESIAIQLFDAQFVSKTGVAYDPSKKFEQQDGFYDCIKYDVEIEAGNWDYFVSDAVDGKYMGWYPFTKEDAETMDIFWQTFQSNGRYTKRILQLEQYSYLIDLVQMTQTNIQTNKQRPLRRGWQEMTDDVFKEKISKLITPKQLNQKPKAIEKKKVLHHFSIATVNGNAMEVNLALVDIAGGIDKFIDLALVYSEKNAYIWTIEGVDNVQTNETFEGPMTRSEGAEAFQQYFKSYTENKWGDAFVKQPNKYDILNVPNTQDVIENYARGKQGRVILFTFVGTFKEKELIEDVYRWYQANPKYPQRRIKLSSRSYCFDFSKLNYYDCETKLIYPIDKLRAIA